MFQLKVFSILENLFENFSISKKKILAFIENSSKKYDSKTKELQALVKEIADSHNTINDNHTIMKIVLTLAILEKYQNENLPKTDKFLETIEKRLLKYDLCKL